MINHAKILITGGWGFLGGHLAHRLADAELANQIVIFDQTTGPNATGSDLGLNQYSNITVVHGSILDNDDLLPLGDDFDYIIHCAGYLGVQKVADNQLINMDVNVLGSRNLLEVAVRQKKLQLYVQFSTSEIYGVDAAHATENDDSVIKTVGERWTYAASKLAAEYYVKAFQQKYGLKAAIIRPFNVYGPFRYGGNAMTALISNAIAGEDLIITGDGQQIRAWCYVDDFCSGVMAILSSKHATGEVFNIGDDRAVLSMESLARKIVSITNSSSAIHLEGTLAEDVRERKPNITKAQKILQYAPVTSLEDGIAGVASWLKAKR